MEPINSQESVTRRTKAQIDELLGKFDKSPGMTVKTFCKLHQISEASFYSSRRRHRMAGASTQKPSGFITIPRTAFKESSGSLFAEVNGIKLYQVVPADYLKALIV